MFELSGDLPLQVKQSTRSLKAIQVWEQAQQGRAAQRAERAARQQAKQAQPAQDFLPAEGLAAQCEGGVLLPLLGPVRPTKKFLVCEGPPSAVLWVGSISGWASQDDVRSVFGRWAG